MVWMVCFNNVASIDQAMQNTESEARQVIAETGTESAKMFLSSLSAMENTRLLSGWEFGQAPLGLLAIVVLFLERPSRLLIVLPVVMLLLVGFEHFLITPEIGWLSQALAFVPDGTAVAQRGRLENMYRIYGFVDAAKVLTGGGLAILLFAMRSGRQGRRTRRTDSPDFVERRAAV